MASSVRIHFSSSVRLVLLAVMIVLLSPAWVNAQDGVNDTPLGDVARSFRTKPASPDVVIDNDNFSKVVEDAESRRATGTTMVFSLDPGSAKSFHVSSPDVSCSLSFTAKASSLLSDPVMLDELPRSELAKLDGPATIDGDSLQVSVHNGTSWELREVVIGLTILRHPDGVEAGNYGAARIVPASVGGSSHPTLDSSPKQPDVTVLLRVKGSAAPSATALFRTQLNFALFPDQEWHWAIVRAKGVAPQTPPEAMTMQADQSPKSIPGATTGGGTTGLSLPPSESSSSSSPSSPDVVVH